MKVVVEAVIIKEEHLLFFFESICRSCQRYGHPKEKICNKTAAIIVIFKPELKL